MNPRFLTCLLCLSLTATPVVASQDILKKTDTLFTEWSDPAAPGLAVAVIQNGESTYKRGFGSANIENGTVITPETVFYLASVGKQFTTMAIALLQQDGKLDVDDDIRKYIPEIPVYGSTITIRHLIHHTSGIRDYLGLMRIAGLPLGTYHDDQDVVDLIARQKALNFEPGKQYLYSNSGYFLLAVIVERASGKSLRGFAAERIFGPLGMTDSHFHDDYTHPIPGRAMSYYPGDDGELDVFLSTFDRVGSGGVYSNISDLLKWDRNFYDQKVGGKQVHDWMLQQGALDDGTQLGYAWGLTIGEYRGLRTVQHGGALGGYRTALLRFPDQQFSVIILANIATANPSGLAAQVAEFYLEDKMTPIEEGEKVVVAGPDDGEKPGSVEIPAAILEAHTGLFYSEGANLIRKILMEKEHLVYSRGSRPGANTSLTALDANQFVMVGEPLKIIFRPGGMSVGVQGDPPIQFRRLEAPGTDELEPFVGRYYSPEVDITVGMSVGEKGIILHHPRERNERPEFIPVGGDKFLNLDIGKIQFRRNGHDGTPSSFDLDTGRVKGIHFERVSERGHIQH
ncbi:MAG: beta-lactamase family protein [Gammaproteobacteria bacterium]|nr:beta-lactamase family protein [Gammaproteobacteria bacterium]